MKENQYMVFNTIVMNIKTVLVVIIFFLSSRYLLQALGVDGFGLYNLIIGVTVTLDFIISGLTSTTSRFTLLAIGKNDIEYSRKVFNTINNANGRILIWFLAILEAFGMIMVIFILKIPEGKLVTSVVIFQIMVLDTYYKIKVIPYNALLIAKENFLFINVVAIAVAILRLAFILLLFVLPFDRLIFYALIMFVLSFASREITIRFVSGKYPEAVLGKQKYYDVLLQKEILSFLKFSWIGQMSGIIKKQGANFLLNIFSGGVALNAAYAVAGQVPSISDMAFAPVSQSIMPQAVKSYSAGNISRFKKLTVFNSKLAITLSWIIMIPLLLEPDFILNIWLKDVPQFTSQILMLILVDEMIRQLTNGINVSSIVADKVKKLYLINTIIQSMAFFLLLLFFKIGFQFWIIFYANIVISLLYVFINLYFAHKYLSLNSTRYFTKVILPSTLIGSFTISIMLIIKPYLITPEFVNSLIVIGLSFVFTLVLFFVFLYNQEEKNKIKNMSNDILIKIKTYAKRKK
jgi:hypothetical protein